MSQPAAGASIPEVTHHRAALDDLALHYVSAGGDGSPVLLVHGFPETWWAFHALIPRLAAEHRVIAVDLPGFGDSDPHPGGDTSAVAAESLRQLIEHLGLGAVHLTGQDIGGVSTFRLAAQHPELIRSYTAIETGLPGFGMEQLADVTRGGAWHIGVLTASGIPEMLLRGRERSFLADYAYPSMSATDGAITERDVEEFSRAYSRPGGFQGASGLYRSMLSEGDEIRQLVAERPLTMPVLAVGAGTGPFTHDTMSQVAPNVTEATLDGIGHLAAMEDPQALAEALLGFYRPLDA